MCRLAYATESPRDSGASFEQDAAARNHLHTLNGTVPCQRTKVHPYAIQVFGSQIAEVWHPRQICTKCLTYGLPTTTDELELGGQLKQLATEW